LRNRSNILLLLILALAAGLRFYGLDWSLPHTYEEATPLRVAIGMWGWQHNGPVTFNPGFFNYPSLTFYIHFLVQGLVFVVLRLAGDIKTVADWYVLYLADPTSQYIGARLVGVCFGVATVFVTFQIARHLTSAWTALLAALLLATNPFHIARSQMIEVDVPLVFFVALGLYGILKVIEHGRRRDYVLTGIAIGLATSAKYTGLFLVAPFVAAHALVLTRPTNWKRIIGAMLLAIIAFAATSPYVLADLHRSWAGLSGEREHMELGHFGVTESAWAFYGHVLTNSLLGVAGLLVAIIGVFACVKRASKPALTLLAFCLVYGCVIATWSTKADRYLLPVLPPLLVFASCGVEATVELAKRLVVRSRTPSLAGALLGCVLLTWNLGQISHNRAASQHDTRTDAQEWIEKNLPGGAFVVTEGYGPDLLDPATLTQLDPGVRTRVLERWRTRPVFAVTALPMYQTRPERSAPFYSLALYPEADYFITSSSIVGRYESEPDRFRTQLDFYNELKDSCRTLKEFHPAEKGGILLTVFEARTHGRPFGLRRTVVAPPQLNRSFEDATGREAGFYFTMATNYEYFRHFAEAAKGYQLALEYRTTNPQLFLECALGYTRCLLATGRTEEALGTLDQMMTQVDDRRLKGALSQLRTQVESAVHKH